MKSLKKSQVFMFDFIFAFVILFVSLGIVFVHFSNTTDNIDVYDINNQILDAFTTTKVNDLNDASIRQMFILRQITNIENTVAQQVGQFYYQGDMNLARNLSAIFIDDFVTNQMNVNITLVDGATETIMYEASSSPITFDDSEISSVNRRLFFGFIDESNSFGPYSVVIRIWQ